MPAITLSSRFLKCFGRIRNHTAPYLAMAALSCVLVQAQTPATNKVVGYWEGSGTPNVKLLTHLNYAFASVVSYIGTDHLTHYTCQLNNASTLATKFQAFKVTNPKLKILISVGGAYQPASDFSAAAQDSTFAANCVQQTLGQLSGTADGLDIDWEFPISTDQQNFPNLLTALKGALPANGLLTAAIGMGPTSGEAGQNANTVFPQSVLTAISFFNVMTYDAYSTQASTFGAPLYASTLAGYGTYNGTASTTITNLIGRGVPVSQLVLGIPFYGVNYPGLSGPDTIDGLYRTPTQGSTTINYNQIVNLPGTKYCDTGATTPTACPATWGQPITTTPASSQEAWIYNGTSVTTFDDTGTVAAKVKYATDNGLGGVMVWELMQDTSSATLLTAISNAMPGTPNAPPTSDSVTPNTGSGASQSFAFKYSSSSGYHALSLAYAVINSGLSGANGCVSVYVVNGNSLYLYNDAGTVLTGPITPGATGTLTNSQCTINGPTTSETGAGNTLTLTLAVTFKPAFNGSQTMYGYAIDTSSRNSGWQTLGTWKSSTVINTPPTADSVTPSTGSGTSQNFAFKYSSANGYQYLNVAYGVINSGLSGANGCVPVYLVNGNALYLYNDAGTAFAGPITPGSAGTLTNSQCTINGPTSSAIGSGNTLTLTLAVSFKSTFSGLQTVYGYAVDNGNQNSGWQTLGTWTSGTIVNTPPTADSVTPSTGTGLSQSFAFKYSSANGFHYLNLLYGIINSGLSGAGGCVPVYLASGNALYLYNDAGTVLTGPITPGATGTLTNSQCTINGPTSSASGSGNTLTLTLAVTFKSVMATQTIYGYAADNGNQNSGWKTLGTWKP